MIENKHRLVVYPVNEKKEADLIIWQQRLKSEQRWRWVWARRVGSFAYLVRRDSKRALFHPPPMREGRRVVLLYYLFFLLNSTAQTDPPQGWDSRVLAHDKDCACSAEVTITLYVMYEWDVRKINKTKPDMTLSDVSFKQSSKSSHKK